MDTAQTNVYAINVKELSSGQAALMALSAEMVV